MSDTIEQEMNGISKVNTTKASVHLKIWRLGWMQSKQKQKAEIAVKRVAWRLACWWREMHFSKFGRLAGGGKEEILFFV